MTTSSRRIRATWVLCGRKDYWACFAGNFEAKTFDQKLHKLLKNEQYYLDVMYAFQIDNNLFVKRKFNVMNFHLPANTNEF